MAPTVLFTANTPSAALSTGDASLTTAMCLAKGLTTAMCLAKGIPVQQHGGQPGQGLTRPASEQQRRRLGVLDPRLCGLHSSCVPVQTLVLSYGGPSSGWRGPPTHEAQAVHE